MSREHSAELFKRATQAVQRKDYDYAIELMTTAIKLSPDVNVYRQFIRGAEREKHGNNGSGARMSGMRLTGVKTKIKKARMQKKWADIDSLAEEGLKMNPWDTGLLSDLATAAAERGFSEVAIDAYDTALKVDPSDVEMLRAFGNLLMDESKYDRAIDVWERVAKLVPNDGEARTNISHCHTRRTIDKNFDEEEETGENAPPQSAYDEDDRYSQKDNVVGPGDDPEEDLKRAIRKEPENPAMYSQYADWLREQKRLLEAEEQLDKAVELSGGDHNLREKREDFELQRLQNELTELKEKAASDPELKDKVTAAKRTLIKRRIEVLTAREKRYQSDMRIKFDLATLFMQVGKYKLAIPKLQQAQNDIRLKGKALLALGKCFLQEKNVKLALRNISKAIEEMDPQDDKNELCEAHYLAGRVYEQTGEAEQAEDHYNEVLSLDFEFRDAQTRLEKLSEA